MEKGSLIHLKAPVYGLDDAPIRGRNTLLRVFRTLGFKRSLLEPCWLVKRADNKIAAMVLIEVDDINLAVLPKFKKEIKEAMSKRFKFGKWEESEGDFAGHHVKVTDQVVAFDQHKYITEKIHSFKLAKGRLSDKASLLTTEEFEPYRSLLYRVNWVVHQTRPEAAGVVSILSSRLERATVHDLTCLNKLVSHLRSTSQQRLTLHKFKTEATVFIAASDAGGVDSVPVREDPEAVTDNTQGAWIIMASDVVPSAFLKCKASILSWRFSRLKRKVSSTLAGEALAFSQVLSEMECLQVMMKEVVYGDVDRKDWQSKLGLMIQC